MLRLQEPAPWLVGQVGAGRRPIQIIAAAELRPAPRSPDGPAGHAGHTDPSRREVEPGSARNDPAPASQQILLEAPEDPKGPVVHQAVREILEDQDVEVLRDLHVLDPAADELDAVVQPIDSRQGVGHVDHGVAVHGAYDSGPRPYGEECEGPQSRAQVEDAVPFPHRFLDPLPKSLDPVLMIQKPNVVIHAHGEPAAGPVDGPSARSSAGSSTGPSERLSA